MAIVDIDPYLNLISAVRDAPRQSVWVTYDAEAAVLYVNFRKPSEATDSELTEDDIILRYEGEDLVGMTVLRASERPQCLGGSPDGRVEMVVPHRPSAARMVW